MRISQKQIESVLKLDANGKYNHFIKRVTNTMEVFALYQDGWALASDGEHPVFPVFPAKEYAELCANGEWAGYEVIMIPLDEFMNELLPKLKKANTLIGIFYSPNGSSTTPKIEQVIGDLNIELKDYE